jgi:hypothetical protein
MPPPFPPRATDETCTEIKGPELSRLDGTLTELRRRSAAAEAAMSTNALQLPSIANSCDTCMPLPITGRRMDGEHARRLQSVSPDFPLLAATRDQVDQVLYYRRGSCLPRAAITYVSFANATLVASNLGGIGGRCTSITYNNGNVEWYELCREPQPGSVPAKRRARHTHTLKKRTRAAPADRRASRASLSLAIVPRRHMLCARAEGASCGAWCAQARAMMPTWIVPVRATG